MTRDFEKLPAVSEGGPLKLGHPLIAWKFSPYGSDRAWGSARPTLAGGNDRPSLPAARPFRGRLLVAENRRGAIRCPSPGCGGQDIRPTTDLLSAPLWF